LKGNYLGYIDFDGVRYWDARDTILYPVEGVSIEKALPSDSRNRIDAITLLEGDVDKA
jgi:hypothetical protein